MLIAIIFHPCDNWRYDKWMYNENGDAVFVSKKSIINIEQKGGTNEWIDRGVNDDGSVYIESPTFIVNPSILKITIDN